MNNLSLEFDRELDSISHYMLYPELKVWIGSNYGHARSKILILGESHYLPRDCTQHHNVVRWYEGLPTELRSGFGWLNTRKIIANGIQNGWKERSKSIYRNIETAIFESKLLLDSPATAFTEVAYMNFFQRPAESTGGSIRVRPEDVSRSAEVLKNVAAVIQPNIVMFASSLAWRWAEASSLDDFLRHRGVSVGRAPHPGMPWWNRSSRKYDGKSGRRHFIDQIDSYLPS